MTTLSVVIPAYNEEDGIQAVMDRVLAIRPALAEAGFADLELIVVDDCSSDQTAALVAATPGARLIQHGCNGGYGAALKTGFTSARHDWVFYTDGDNQFDLDEIRSLLPLRRDCEIVSAYRIRRCDPFIRRVNEAIFNAVIRVLFGLRLRDVDCAFKLYRASIFESMELQSEGAMIDVEILAGAARRGARIAQVGVHHYPRTAGRPTGGNLSVIARAVRELFRLRARLR